MSQSRISARRNAALATVKRLNCIESGIAQRMGDGYVRGKIEEQISHLDFFVCHEAHVNHYAKIAAYALEGMLYHAAGRDSKGCNAIEKPADTSRVGRDENAR